MFTICDNYSPRFDTTSKAEVRFWLALGYLAFARPSGREIDEWDLS